MHCHILSVDYERFPVVLRERESSRTLPCSSILHIVLPRSSTGGGFFRIDCFKIAVLVWTTIFVRYLSNCLTVLVPLLFLVVYLLV